MAAPPGILEVRCAGCGETLEVEHGLTEFACPDCGMAQALAPELMPPRPRRALPLPGRVAPYAAPAAPLAPARVVCGGCGSVLSVPHGPGRFACPLCSTELASSPLDAVPVGTTPSAVPISSSRMTNHPEVQHRPSSQSARAGMVQRPTHSEQTHGQHPNHYFGEESFSSFRADSRTQTDAVRRLQNEPLNPSVHREESHTEPVQRTIARPGKKYIFVVGPKSCQEGNVQEEQPNQVDRPSQAQVIPTKSSIHATQAEGGFKDDTISMHNKPTTEHVPSPSAIEHEQISSPHQVVHEQQAGEIPSDAVQVEQEKVDSACKPSGKNKKRTKSTKGNHKRKNKKFMNSPNEWSHLRRSKRLSKGSPDLIDIEPIQKIDASPHQNHSEAPQIESTIDPAPSSPTRYLCPQAGSIELDNIDVTPAPTMNHGALQTEQSPHCYGQTYSPETRWVLPNPSSNSWREHEIHRKSFNGFDELDKSDDEVRSNPSENQNHMDGQVAETACSGKNYSEQVRLKPHSEKFAGHGRQMNLAASCSRLAAMLPFPAATTFPTIASLSSLEKLPPQCSSPTTPQHQPRTTIHSQDAHCDDIPSGSLSKSSKKRRGRPPAVLMEPCKEADRPVLTPNGKDWSVHPPGPKVATILSLLIKQYYPGTCISVDTAGRSREVVVHYWHQCPPDLRATVLDEFLKRYKWSPGQEEECQKIFERKVVRQLVNMFCYEKQRVREELAAKKLKRSSTVGRASGEMALEKGDVREDSEDRQGDESVGWIDPEDPLNWKPFVPDWLQPKWWEMLCDHWSQDEFMKVSYQKRKNRNAGSHPCDAAGSRSTTTHQHLLDTTYQHTEETSHTPPGAHSVQEQVGSSKRERRYGAPVVSKKAQTDSSSKSSPDCLNNQGQQPTFTQEQVQQMINRALQGLNETWEKKFLSLEQNMRSMSSSRVVPAGGRGSVATLARDKQCLLARQDSFDSADGERDPDARDGRREAR
ncbi:unnamed protein product [Alopecurus aequalis]